MTKKRFFLLFLPFFVSCGYFSEKKNSEQQEAVKDTLQNVFSEGYLEESIENQDEIENQKEIEIFKNEFEVSETENVRYKIHLEKTDSITFFKIKQGIPIPEKIEKITDFADAKKYLKGIVEFGITETFGDGESVFYPEVPKIIHARNRKKIENKDPDAFFVAYFPSEDILLCEGGHATDVSFDLKDGRETEQTGNPDYFVYSPDKTLRFNGWFGGQECSTLFIQKKLAESFEMIVSLDVIFEEATKQWLCNIGTSFWANNEIFYFQRVNMGHKNQYFKLTLKEI